MRYYTVHRQPNSINNKRNKETNDDKMDKKKKTFSKQLKGHFYSLCLD